MREEFQKPSDKIKEILLIKGFTWVDETKRFCFVTNFEKITFDFLENLCEEIKKIS